MSALMPKGSEALPSFKVLYRNSNRIQEFGGRESETLHALSASAPANEANAASLHDEGRLPQNEDRLKPAGCVHGDSVGVHASDAANAWRNLARVSSGRNIFACLMIGVVPNLPLAWT